jgi:signal transduction histidine kinase/ActR/RegA family two-component response regulator
MVTDISLLTGRRPSRAVSLAVSAALVVIWGFIRLVLFEGTVFPLAYAVALLVGVWTRDRAALWGMAVIFAVFHTLKMFWILPAGVLTEAEIWSTYGSTLANIAVAAVAVHAIIVLRERLERALVEVNAQAEELRAQGEELAQQNEELAQQNEEMAEQAEELSQQGEELATQNEELESRAEEIRGLNDALERRERLLHTLLETARLSGTEQAALQHIATAALDLFGDTAAAVMILETQPGGTHLMARAGRGEDGEGLNEDRVDDAFVALVTAQGRTASLNDRSLRPDLTLATAGGRQPFRAALCAPIHLGDETFGALAVYAGRPREWTEEDFRLAEWLADQCARMLQTLRVQSVLRETDRRKSEFLATLSHELRNPLTPIGFALKLIEQGKGHDANAVQIMQRQLQQLVRLVDDLLEATRLTSNKIQIRKARVDLVPVVRHAVEALRPDIDAAGHDLAVVLPDEPVWLDADADRLGQVVTNLLNNAARYTPPGGRVSIEVAAGTEDVRLLVRDTGVGLDPHDLDRVFDMFMQVGGPGSGGLGIGLALVRQIAELHGGRVEARSDGRGRGSEFRVTLPVAAAAASADDAADMDGPESRNACRVLIVDDNVDSATMIGALLEMHGHDVRIAHDAEGALAAAHDFSPGTAVLDIGLPGTNGYELARQLRQDVRTREMRLIALTGWGQDGDRARAREAGFDTHLTKPIEPDVILAAIGDSEPV